MSDDLPADANDDSASPGPALRFDTVPYRPDGGCPPLGLLLTLVLMFLVAVPAGLVASTVIPLIWAIPFVPDELTFLLYLAVFFILAALVAGAGRLGVRLGKVRNPVAATVASVLGVGVLVASTAYCEYEALMVPGNFVPEREVMAYISYGAAAVGGAALAVFGLRSKASAPFCTDCRTWKVARLSRRLDLTSDFLVKAIKTGDIVPLADHDLSRNTGPLVLNVAVCPRCGPDAPVDVQVQQTTVGPRGEKKVHELAHVTYPGEAMRVLDALFEPPPRR
jgi:hypothetical protein